MDQKRKLKNCLKNIVLGALFLVQMLGQDFQKKTSISNFKINVLFFFKKEPEKKTFQKKKIIHPFKNFKREKRLKNKFKHWLNPLITIQNGGKNRL